MRLVAAGAWLAAAVTAALVIASAPAAAQQAPAPAPAAAGDPADRLTPPPEPPPSYQQPLPELEAPPPPPPAGAAPAPPPGKVPAPSIRRRDEPTHEGFFARVTLGLGYQTMESQREGLAGVGFFGSAAIGFTPLENLAVHIGFHGVSVFSGDFDSGASLLDGNDAAVETTAFTGGATYYVMPINVYFSANAGIGLALYQVRGRPANATDVGVSAAVLVGKEWWIDTDWALGAALELLYLNLGGAEVDDVARTRWNIAAAGIVLSSTFN